MGGEERERQKQNWMKVVNCTCLLHKKSINSNWFVKYFKFFTNYCFKFLQQYRLVVERIVVLWSPRPIPAAWALSANLLYKPFYSFFGQPSVLDLIPLCLRFRHIAIPSCNCTSCVVVVYEINQLQKPLIVRRQPIRINDRLLARFRKTYHGVGFVMFRLRTPKFCFNIDFINRFTSKVISK